MWFDEETRVRLRRDGYIIEEIPDLHGLRYLFVLSKEKYGIDFSVNPEDDEFDWDQVETISRPAHQVAWKPELVENSSGMPDWVEEKLDEWKKQAPPGTSAVLPSAEDCAYLMLMHHMRTGERFLDDFELVCCTNRYSKDLTLSIDTYFVQEGRFMHLHRIHKSNEVGGILNFLVPYKA